MRYFTFRKDALRAKHWWQKLRFLAGKGYFLVGKSPQITMYDSIDLAQIPPDTQAVAGYVGGRWPTYPLLVKWPFAKKLSIAVVASEDAECLDVEKGDASITEAPAWVKRQQKRGVRRPVVYCSVSDAVALLKALNQAGVRRGDVRLWTAHYTFTPHRCDQRCGFGMWTQADATQFSDHALGRNLDASLCSPGFFD